MFSLNPSYVETPLEQMWHTHREQVRRTLIGLTRDIDLTEDILQETYLCACSGFASYRGGDAKAWLTSIAKNAFYTHARRKYFDSEVPLESDLPASRDLLGSSQHVFHISVRQAIDSLPVALRQALLMKHFGGFTYSEIAERLGCPQGTAQRRVFTAIRRLRKTMGTLEEEHLEMVCGELTGKRLIDYVYSKLSPDDMEAAKQHLSRCPKCRKEVNETIEIFRGLDSVQSGYKMIFFIEPWRCYLTVTTPVLDQDQSPFELGSHWRIVYAAMEGEEVVMEELPSEDDPARHRYILHPPRQVEVGETVEVMFVAEQDKWDTSNEEVLTAHGAHSLPVDSVWMIAVRLDPDETIVSTDPEPTEVRTNGHTTVYYRKFLSANQEFEWTVQYKGPRSRMGGNKAAAAPL